MSGSKTLGFSCDLLVLVTIIGLQGLELLKDQNPGAREDAAGMGDQWWVQGICLPFLSINESEKLMECTSTYGYVCIYIIYMCVYDISGYQYSISI